MYSYHIWRAWYNGSYTMMAKPIRAVELHYPLIQFIIIKIIGAISMKGYFSKRQYHLQNLIPISRQGAHETRVRPLPPVTSFIICYTKLTAIFLTYITTGYS